MKWAGIVMRVFDEIHRIEQQIVSRTNTYCEAIANGNFLSSCFLPTGVFPGDILTTGQTNAVNYYIDVTRNPLKGARFSFPEVISLLGSLNIEIVDE